MTDYKFSSCAGFGHPWRKPEFGTDPDMPGVTKVTFQCVECTTTRIDLVSRVTGQLYKREYIRPEGYTLEDRPTRAEFKIAAIREATSDRA